MDHASDTLDAGLRDLDAFLARPEAKVDALPSRALIAGMLVRALVPATAAMTLGLGALGGFAFFVAR